VSGSGTTRARALALGGVGVIVAGMVVSIVLDQVGSTSVGQAGNALFILCLVAGLALVAAGALSAVAARIGRRGRRGRRLRRTADR
jgi:divalent metal cation (Fe/Co/Zn/Cd) transporter